MNLLLSYQKQLLPPPYAYAATIRAEITDNQTDLSFRIEYLDRESVAEDEVIAEGFSKDDDFEWSGSISSSWNETIRYFQTSKYNSEPEEETYLHVEMNEQLLGFPKEIEKAELIFQELMQAVLELAQIEAPLMLKCFLESTTYELIWSFSNRTVTINNGKHIKWEKGQKLLKSIFSLDFESLEGMKKPKRNSLYPGDGKWYELIESDVLEELKASLMA